MANRFPGKTCVLCPTPSHGVGEHVWPNWLIRFFQDEGPFTTEKAGTPYFKPSGERVTHNALPGCHVPMCLECNNHLNRTIEEWAKPVVRRIIPRSADHDWPTISAEDAGALARWLLKVGLLLGHPDAVPDSPHVDRDTGYPRFETVKPEWIEWMLRGSPPPHSFSVFIAKRAPDLGGEWHGETQRILLRPGFVSGASELRPMSRSLGIRGLDVDFVWHPGSPQIHPGEAGGRVARLWPEPHSVDFSSLPYVHPKEFCFAI